MIRTHHQTASGLRASEVTKLAYLAEAIVDAPDQFESFVADVENFSSGEPSPEFKKTLEELREFWRQFNGAAPSVDEIARAALEFEDNEKDSFKRIVAAALNWAVENRYWRDESESPLDPESEKTRVELQRRAMLIRSSG